LCQVINAINVIDMEGIRISGGEHHSSNNPGAQATGRGFHEVETA
jgi:hypothetical protein